ncbi:PocR ligand-binding domain-containing protein, partial [Porcipelethomonas sp.]|uniref:PocR ligand-binding domain-containing protein n=1 Tax=Porcipelethomonas sp. TaxID=2981675 RepID=UPI003EF41078
MGCDKAGAELTMKSGRACTYYCHAGLVDYAAPIIVNGKMIGSFIGGQVLPEKPNYDRFRETALELGIDPEKYVEAVKKVQIIDKSIIDKSAQYLSDMASTLSFLAYQSHEIKKRNKEIAKASSMKSDFLANMSHEIRTPMNAVIGLVDLALREDMSPDAKEYMHQIKSSAKNLLVNIKGLDTEAALALIGNEELFFTILKEYYTSIDKKSKTILEHKEAEHWRDYTIEVHSLKSTSKQIGANKVSALAAELERAGNEGNYSLINEKTAEMLSEFQLYKEILAPLFPDVQISAEEKTAGTEDIMKLLEEMKEALDDFDTLQIDDVIEKMSGYKYPETQTGYFENLKQSAEISDLDECLKIVEKWQ